MTRQSNHIVKAAIISALIVIGGVSSTANAGGNRSGHHRHTDTCGHRATEYAGSVTIDGHRTRIRSDRPMLGQISNAFRRAGYYARVVDGRVQVDYGYDRPSVRWSRDRYGARFRWDCGELSVSVHRIHRVRRESHWDSGHSRRHIWRAPRRSNRWGICD